MAFFTNEFLEFFKELARNNHKEWFNDHRKRYHEFVREPMKAFVAHMRMRLAEWDPEIEHMDLKNALFRINNDIRFSKDKPLYKIHMAAFISKGGRKEMHRPGFYMQLGPDAPFIAGGSYMPSKEDLLSIRRTIAKEPEQFYSIIRENPFRDILGGLGPSKVNKRLPKDLQSMAKNHPVLLNKQFYYSKEYNPNLILREDFDEYLLTHYKMAEPFRKYLKAAVEG